MKRIDQLSAKVKELRERQYKHERRKQKVYKTKIGKWLDTSLETYFSNWFKKTKDPRSVEFFAVFVGFGCFLITSVIVLMFSAWLALIYQVLWAAIAWKVACIFERAVHAWNCSLTEQDPTYYDGFGGRIKFERIVPKDVFNAALNELEQQEPAAQDLVQQLRDNPLSPHDSQIVMNYLDNFWDISELSLFRKGAVTPVSAVTVETPDMQNTDIVELVRTLRL